MAIRPILPMVDYVVNYNFIVKNLCENRAKPEILCNGKCYLKKELAETSNTSNKAETIKINASAFDAFIVAETNFEVKNPSLLTLKNSKIVSHSFDILTQFSSPIFHPPIEFSLA